MRDKLNMIESGFQVERNVANIGNLYYTDVNVQNKDDVIMSVSEADNAGDTDGQMKEEEIVDERDKTDRIGKTFQKRKHTDIERTSGKICIDLNDIQFTLRRCNQQVDLYTSKTDAMNDKTVPKLAVGIEEREVISKLDERFCLRLEELWKYDTGKCVDASPLLIVKSRFVVLVQCSL